jgi:hypothetical protein
MKKKKTGFWLIGIAVLVMAMGSGCGSIAPAGTTTVKISEADFKSQPNGILKINNFTNFDVAIFAGKVERGTFLGAIKARGARNFDISKLPSIPKEGAFLFRATSYQTLGRKGMVGITEDDVLYTGLVAYNLNRPDRIIEQDVFRNVDEAAETFIYVSNITKYIVQLRLDSPDGEKVGVLSPGQRNKKLWIKKQEDGLPYRFFPTYIYVNPNTGEMDVFTDMVNKTGTRFEPRAAGPQVRVVEFQDPVTQPGGKQYTVAFIKLQNDTNSLLSFETARSMYTKNERGSVNTNPGDSDTYELAADTGEAGRTYTNLGVEHDGGHMVFAPPLTFKPGYQYSIVVTQMNGNFQHDWRELGKKSEVEQNRIPLFME